MELISVLRAVFLLLYLTVSQLLQIFYLISKRDYLQIASLGEISGHVDSRVGFALNLIQLDVFHSQVKIGIMKIDYALELCVLRILTQLLRLAQADLA